HFRERVRAPVNAKSASQRWGEAREAELLRAGKPAVCAPKTEKEVPTLSEFWPRFIEGTAKPIDTSRAESKVRKVHIAFISSLDLPIGDWMNSATRIFSR